MKYRATILTIILVTGFTAVIGIIWDQEFKNYLVSGDYSELAFNSKLELEFLPEEKPSYLHFFSEDCRNARININHIHRIIAKYENEVDFFIVNVSDLEASELRDKYEIPTEVKIIQDQEGLVTNTLNVKSLPYALISTSDQRLFFGGNYNGKNGLCGSNEIIWSSPAVALKFLVKHQQPPLFPSHQLSFLGCGVEN